MEISPCFGTDFFIEIINLEFQKSQNASYFMKSSGKNNSNNLTINTQIGT